jgi:hypothetical protein
MESKRNRSAIVALCLVAGTWAAACGMVPPREYHEAEKAENVDVNPLPPPGEASADAGTEAEASPDGPNMGTLPVGLPWSVVPAMTIAQVLGKTREEIEGLQAPVEAESREEKAALKEASKLGWTRYTPNLRVRFDDADLAVAFEQQVPSTLSCEAAAKWLGFDGAAAPEQTEPKCSWIPKSGAGGLGNGVAGELDRKTSLFTATAPAQPQN